jgi:hypothetical protein
MWPAFWKNTAIPHRWSNNGNVLTHGQTLAIPPMIFDTAFCFLFSVFCKKASKGRITGRP